MLLEIAIAAGLVAWVFGGAWLPVGAATSAVCAVLALVTVHGRPLYGVIRSWFGMRLRRPRGRREAARPGDQFRVVTVPSAGRGAAVGVIQGETTWSVPLEMPLSSVLNDDAPIDLDRLAALLRIEGVPLANVRVVTVVWPAMPAAESLVGPGARPAQRASRHLVLTLDTAYAADVIVERGGTPAIHQILRRCVLRAEELLHVTGVEVRRLSERAVAAAAAGAVGRTVTGPDVSLFATGESMGQVELADGAAHTFAVTGSDVLLRLAELAQQVPAPVVATSVVLQSDDTGRTPTVTVLMRVSGPTEVVGNAVASLGATAALLGLRVAPVVGDQLPLLQATTLLGVPRERAA
ncbi:hypothetical protein GCM10009797_40750 [Nocardioides hwasunensis]